MTAITDPNLGMYPQGNDTPCTRCGERMGNERNEDGAEPMHLECQYGRKWCVFNGFTEPRGDELFVDNCQQVFASVEALAWRLRITRSEMLGLRERSDFPERGDIETVGDIDDHVEQIRTWMHKAHVDHGCAKCCQPFTVHEWLYREIGSDEDGIDAHSKCPEVRP